MTLESYEHTHTELKIPDMSIFFSGIDCLVTTIVESRYLEV